MRLRPFVFCFLLAASSSYAAAATDLPKFDEVYKLLHDNLSGVNQEELDHAAVRGLLGQFQSRVKLAGAPSGAEGNAEALSKSEVYDGGYEYFRIGKVTGDLASRFLSNQAQLRETNKAKIKGLILDLRFAQGADYAGAGAMSDLFLNADQLLLDWGNGSARSTVKTNAISVPVAILVNGQTTGAAEALAAVLREFNAGLIIGSPTAGQASVFKEFSLSNGGKLQIATEQIKIGNDKVMTQGVVPDIALTTSAEDEMAYFKDPYAILHKPKSTTSVTNQTDEISSNRARRRFNEAELVRQQREGVDAEDETAVKPRKEEPGRPVISDPALARALDLLKALAVVQQGSASIKER